MPILMAGIDHNRAELDIRSRFSFTKRMMEDAFTWLKRHYPVDGCVILSTCNRMEIWLSTGDESLSPTEALCAFMQADPGECARYFVERREREAVDHLFRLAAGLESKVVGEDQIVTQVNEALAFARSCDATGHALEALFRMAVTAAKRVKTQTSLSLSDSSVIHAALKALRGQGLSFSGKNCMVIGSGMMGKISAQALLDDGARVCVTVRKYRKGIVDIPAGCSRVDYDDRLALLPECDLVVSATSSPNYTLCREDLEALHPGHPVTLIDLAVPRDIEKSAEKLDWATLYDIDSFGIDLESEKVRENLRRAEAILEEEKEAFFAWYEGRDVVPRIQELKDIAAGNVAARMVPAFKRARLAVDAKENLEQEIEGASSRMMNNLLFGMRSRLSEDVFRECLGAMEASLKSWKHN
ncbi:MAG: glutamyl-tRNA reductase [Clostridia bacterium]|nr:glutamyl-tRNA reductase [Clostridia bacterium]